MLQEYINALVELLLATNTAFIEGFVHNSRDTKRGIGQTSGNFFYVVEDLGRDGFNGFTIEPFEGAKHVYLVAENWKLIAQLKCVDRFLIIKRLIGQLILETEGYKIEIVGYSTDSESIYEDETGQKLTADIDLFRINFRIIKLVSTDGLDCQPICEEDCC